MNRSIYKGDLILLVAAAIWGGGFVAQRSAMEGALGPMTFNAIRFALGFFVLVPLIAGRARKNRLEGIRVPMRNYALGGAIAGIVLFFGAGFQQIGLIYTTAGRAGFITGLYVLFVPLIGCIWQRRVPAVAWVGSILAVFGLYLLSARGNASPNRGDVWVLGCAVWWAIHVLLIDRFVSRADPISLASTQFAVCAILSAAVAFWTETFHWNAVMAAKGAIVYAGMISVGIAYTLQVVGQRSAPPSHAAILLSLEAVFAALTGYLILDERLSGSQIVGCGMMLAGMVVSQFRRDLSVPPIPSPVPAPMAADPHATRAAEP